MSSLGNLNIELGLNAARFTSELYRSEKSLRQFTQNGKTQFTQLEQCVQGLHDKASLLKNLGAVIGFGHLGSHMLQVADNATALNNKLKLVTDNVSAHSRAIAAVYDISLKTAQSANAVSTVYQSFARNAKELGINQQQIAEISETVAKSMAISGASAATAQATLVQFSQALASGVLRGQEFNSVMEQAPGLAQALATGLGVSTAELRKMANDGQLTTDVLISALERSKSSVDALFGKTSFTVSGAMENLSTATQRWVGELDSATGASQLLVSTIVGIANNLNYLIPIVGAFGVSLAGVKLAQRSSEMMSLANANRQKAIETVNATKATLAHTTAELNATRAYISELQAQINLTNSTRQRIALSAELQAQTTREIALINAKKTAMTQLVNASKSASLLSGALSFLGGPVGALTIAASIGATAWLNYSQSQEEARQKAIEFASNLTELKTKLEEMDSISLRATKAKLEESTNVQQVEVNKLRQEIKNLAKDIEKTPKLRVFEDDSGYQITIDNSKKIAEMQGHLAIKTEELRYKEEKLNQTRQTAVDTASRLATVSDNELQSAMSRLGIVMFDADTNTKNFESSMLLASNTATQAQSPLMTMADRIFGVGDAAAASAKNLYVFSNAARDALLAGKTPIAPQMDEKTQKFFNQMQWQNQMANFRKNGDIAGQARVHLAMNGINGQTVGYAQLLAEAEKMFAGQQSGKGKTSGKSFANTIAELRHRQELAGLKGAAKYRKEAEFEAKEKGYKGKDAEAYIEQFVKTKLAENQAKGGSKTDYKKQFTDQITEMQNRLASLKASASDIVLYGQTSQYQEVKKLTEDIAGNAEKYSAYGTEGVKKLQSMAAQIDEAQQKVAISQFTFDNNEKLQAMEFELSLLGKSRQEQELLQYNHSLDLEATKLKIGMSKENIAQLDIEIAKLKERHAILQQKAEANRSDPVAGFKGGLQAIENDVMNVNENIKSITVSAFSTMSDALNTFVMTGKADFKDMAKSILSDISQMIIKMMLFNAIKSGLSAVGLGGFAEGGRVGGGSFAIGGYTGNGGKYTPAGIVHRGEYVLTKEATSRLGVDYLNYLNYGTRSGFANGGGVALPRVPSANYAQNLNGSTTNQVSITVNVEAGSANETEVASNTEEAKALAKMIESKVLEVIVKQKRNGGLL